MAAFYGSPPMFEKTTVWYPPVIEDWGQWRWEPDLASNRWWQQIFAITRHLIQECQGRYFVGTPEVGGAGDVLSLMRGPDRLSMDLIENPEAVKAGIRVIADTWVKFHEEMFLLTREVNQNGDILPWLSLWAPGRHDQVASDFSTMLSPGMYRDLILPYEAELGRHCGGVRYWHSCGVSHEFYEDVATLPGLKIVGIDCHIGSQITDATPYLDAMDRMLDLVQSIEASGIALAHIDFGGGLGINYNGDTPPAADDLWAQLLAKLDARGFGRKKLMIEPGRSLVGNAGVCLTEVVYVKPGEQKNFCIIDAAMNDLPRPAMYQAFHAIVPLEQPAGARTQAVYDVVGPVCESGDWIGRDRSLAVQAGDQLAVLSAGAYCMSMASNYNTRGRAAELLIDGDKVHLIRERESSADQMRHERLVKA